MFYIYGLHHARQFEQFPNRVNEDNAMLRYNVLLKRITSHDISVSSKDFYLDL